MFIKFTSEAQKILKESKTEMKKLGHSFIGSEHVVLSILNNKNSFLPKLLNYGLNYQIFYQELVKEIGMGNSDNNYYIYTPLLKRVLENAILDVKEKGMDEVGIQDIFLAILDEGEGIANRILNALGINIDNLYEELNTYYFKKNKKKSIINDWGKDLTMNVENNDPLIGREHEVCEIIEILLRRNKNNPLLIGEAGVGKTAIVEEVAKRIKQGNVPSMLLNYHIISISTSSLVAGTKYRGEFEERINKMLKELESSNNVILFIDEIHTLMGAGGAEGAIDASNILKPALARGKIKIIGATTINEYKEFISKDKAFTRRFEKVFIKENTIQETKDILLKLKPIYENYHQVIIPNNIIDNIVDLAEKYLYDKKNPDKSIDVLDMVCTKVSLTKKNNEEKIRTLEKQLIDIKKKKKSFVINHHFHKACLIKDVELDLENNLNTLWMNNSNQKRKKIRKNDVLRVIENLSRIPLYSISNSLIIKKLSNELKKSIVGHDNAINKIVKETNKIFYGIKKDLPLSFLLTGKSGIGKTFLVKEYSRILDIPLIRLDMSEYREAHTISKIIGSPPGYIGYDSYGNILDKIKNNPFCIVLLDEIEKACKEVINLFLQVLDDGIMTDSKGNEISFKNTIIFMTSNIGSNESIGFSKEKKEQLVKNSLSDIFVNRIDHLLALNDLDKDSVKKILLRHQEKLLSKYTDLGLKISLDKNIIENIVSESDIDSYGVRHAIRILDDKIDDLVLDITLKKKRCKKQLV